MQTRLSAFYKGMPLREYRFLLGVDEDDGGGAEGGGVPFLGVSRLGPGGTGAESARADSGGAGEGKLSPRRRRRAADSGAPVLSAADLKALLLDNDLTNFDPVAEAFKVYDPAGTGFVDTSTLRDVFRRLGFGELSEEDMSVLLTTADKDGDGRISLADFRRVLNPEPTATDAPT